MKLSKIVSLIFAMVMVSILPAFAQEQVQEEKKGFLRRALQVADPVIETIYNLAILVQPAPCNWCPTDNDLKDPNMRVDYPVYKPPRFQRQVVQSTCAGVNGKMVYPTFCGFVKASK